MDSSAFPGGRVRQAVRWGTAGPVVAAAVILPESFYLAGLNDSKKLSEAKREAFFSVIQEQALAIGIGVISAEEIDEINIYEATKKAMIAAMWAVSVMATM